MALLGLVMLVIGGALYVYGFMEHRLTNFESVSVIVIASLMSLGGAITFLQEFNQPRH
jgi:hypothetical protein